jgi:hypothetical protein
LSPRQKDREILRGLAKEVAEISVLPAQQETISLCKALNGLKPIRPMVTIDSHVPWNELDGDPALVLHAEDPFCRGMEAEFRRTLYCWRHMRGDMVVEPEVIIPKVIRSDGFGIGIEAKTEAIDPRNKVVSHSFIDQLRTDEDVQRIRPPKIYFDQEATARVEEKAREIFEGVIPVRLQGWVPGPNQWPALAEQPKTRDLVHGMYGPDDPDEYLGGFNPWDMICAWRGADAVLLDLAERPQFMHEIISKLTDAYLSMLDDMEGKGLLGYGQATIATTPAYTDELPHPGFDPARPRAEDIWTMGMAQIFTSVSPTMFKEFEVDYAVKWYAKFGLVYYGCCDVLDNKIDVVRAIPHLRKISMSPWVNVERGAEKIGRDFVFSRKPNPAFLAADSWDPDAVEQDLKDTIDACARHGCPLELILHDVNTVRYRPQRLWDWADIAMRLVRQ